VATSGNTVRISVFKRFDTATKAKRKTLQRLIFFSCTCNYTHSDENDWVSQLHKAYTIKCYGQHPENNEVGRFGSYVKLFFHEKTSLQVKIKKTI